MLVMNVLTGIVCSYCGIVSHIFCMDYPNAHNYNYISSAILSDQVPLYYIHNRDIFLLNSV